MVTRGRNWTARALASVVAVALLPGPSAVAQEHVLDPATRDRRLVDHAKTRAQDLARLATLLETPAAADAARAFGFDAGRLSTALALLNDAELHDLALRAEALTGDPVTGMSRENRIFLILILVLVAAVYVASGGLCLAGCG